MSLSAWEEQALGSIRAGLAESDPKLAALLADFTKLAAGEDMPPREKLRTGSRRAICGGRNRTWNARGGRQRLAYAWAALLLWLTITGALIAVAVAFNRGGGQADGQSRCTQAWPVVCADPSPGVSINR